MHDYTTKIDTKQFWNRKMIETFIKLYKENECLYNKKHPDYKDKTTQILALRSILHKMKQFLPNLKLKDLIEKLKAIRTQFSKELVLVDRAKAMGNTYVPKMWCFNQLEFLRQHLKSLSGDKSIVIDSDAEVSNESDFSSDLNLSKTSTEYRWEREDLKIFINLLKKYPILYNHRHEHFQNKTMKSKARALLLKEAQRIDPKINITIMNYKIRTMIKQYRQELARIKEAQKNNKKYTSRFWCFDLLSFLNSPNSDGTITNNELSDDNNISEMDHTDYEMNNVNNEAFEIEPIHHVIIENESEYAEKLEIEPIEDSKYNHHQNVIDYEYEDNTFEMINTENYEYKDEPLHKTETEFIEETIEFEHPEFTTKMESNMDKSKNNYNIKYEWLGKLVVSQLDIISPKYHNELAADVQSLIRDYIVKSKENLSGQSTDNCKKKKNNKDPSSSSSPNVSFNVRFL